MKNMNRNDLADRRKAADDAKQKLLDRFKTAPKADDPKMLAIRAERKAITEAREKRRIERVEQQRLVAIEAEKQAILDAEKAAAEIKALEEQKRIEADLAVAEAAERKAERDRRYAARRARKGKKG